MRSDSSAIWTSGEPVSLGSRPELRRRRRSSFQWRETSWFGSLLAKVTRHFAGANSYRKGLRQANRVYGAFGDKRRRGCSQPPARRLARAPGTRRRPVEPHAASPPGASGGTDCTGLAIAQGRYLHRQRAAPAGIACSSAASGGAAALLERFAPASVASSVTMGISPERLHPGPPQARQVRAAAQSAGDVLAQDAHIGALGALARAGEAFAADAPAARVADVDGARAPRSTSMPWRASSYSGCARPA